MNESSSHSFSSQLGPVHVSYSPFFSPIPYPKPKPLARMPNLLYYGLETPTSYGQASQREARSGTSTSGR